MHTRHHPIGDALWRPYRRVLLTTLAAAVLLLAGYGDLAAPLLFALSGAIVGLSAGTGLVLAGESLARWTVAHYRAHPATIPTLRRRTTPWALR